MSITFTNVKDKLKKTFSFLKNGNSLFYYFIFLLVVGVSFFASSLFTNEFTTPFTGDYNTQQYAFYLNTYDDWWHFIKTGSFRLYDTNTYLGVNNIGSNSFYSLTDPFFFIVMIFPKQFMGQAMAISTIIRMSLSGLVFYGYLRYMKISDKSARFAGLAYAYCGWTVWYLWFNCYTENALVFVLILWGVEKIIKEKKPWFLMASLFLSGLVNYFFLVCFALMGFVYAMFKWFQQLRNNYLKDNLKILGIGFVGFFVGILMSSIVVLPSVMVALEAPRAAESTYLESLQSFISKGDFKQLFDYIFSWKNIDDKRDYRALFPIIDFFFPVASDRGTPLTRFGNETYDNVAGSIFSYYPFMILFIPQVIRSVRNKKWSHLIAIAFFIISLVTPFFYYLFFGFTKPYSRWTLFVTTSFLTYTADYLDHIKEEKRYNIIIGALFAIAGIIASSLIASTIVKKVDSMSERFFDGSIALSALLGCLYVVVLTVVWYVFINYKHMKRILYGFLVFEVLVMGLLTIEGHGTTLYSQVNYGYTKNFALSSLVEKVNKNDKSYFRAMSSIASDSNKNDGARNGYNGVSFFHSVYNFNVKDFTYWSMFMTYKGGWSGRYIEKRAGLDKFLGIKYYFIEKDRVLAGVPNVSYGFEDISDQYPNDYFYVFEDKDHLDFALSYDTIYPYTESESLNEMESSGSSYGWTALRNDEIYLKGAVLGSEIAEKIIEQSNGDITQKTILNATTMLEAEIIYKKGVSSSWSAKTYDIGEVAKKVPAEDIMTKINSLTPLETRPTKNDGLKHVIFISPTSEANEVYDENGMAFYITAPFKNNQKEDIYLIGEDNKVITYDNHNDDRTSDTSTRRGPRGLYSRKIDGEPAKKVKGILIVPRWSEFNVYEDVCYEGYTSFKEKKLDQHINNPITDIIYKDNHFSFKTNYEKTRFVITQIAYDKGWSIKAKLNDGTVKKIDTYIAQGGFVGFVAEKGMTSYSMDYYTPYLWGGTLLSGIGSIIFISTLFGYIYLDERNRNRQQQEILSLKQ